MSTSVMIISIITEQFFRICEIFLSTHNVLLYVLSIDATHKTLIQIRFRVLDFQRTIGRSYLIFWPPEMLGFIQVELYIKLLNLSYCK